MKMQRTCWERSESARYTWKILKAKSKTVMASIQNLGPL